MPPIRCRLLPAMPPYDQMRPGDMWLARHHGKCPWWDNCDGVHLMVAVPDGRGCAVPWDVDSRASNCTMPQERTHRCWVREGVPPDVTAGKNGHTCGAGAGSIAIHAPHGGYWHGFLDHGWLTEQRGVYGTMEPTRDEAREEAQGEAVAGAVSEEPEKEPEKPDASREPDTLEGHFARLMEAIMPTWGGRGRETIQALWHKWHEALLREVRAGK